MYVGVLNDVTKTIDVLKVVKSNKFYVLGRNVITNNLMEVTKSSCHKLSDRPDTSLYYTDSVAHNTIVRNMEL